METFICIASAGLLTVDNKETTNFRYFAPERALLIHNAFQLTDMEFIVWY